MFVTNEGRETRFSSRLRPAQPDTLICKEYIFFDVDCTLHCTVYNEVYSAVYH